MCQKIYKYHILNHYNSKFYQSHPFYVFTWSNKDYVKEYKKGWYYDNIFVLLLRIWTFIHQQLDYESIYVIIFQ
jgi:hypothetical protein